MKENETNDRILVFNYEEKRYDPKGGHLDNSQEEGTKTEKRIRNGISRSELSRLTDILRDEQTILIQFISDKEQKKIQIYRFLLAAIAILGVSAVAALPLLEKFISMEPIEEMLNSSNKFGTTLMIYSVFNIVGLIAVIAVNLINATVMRYILSIKTNITLASRQLNCNREAIQRAISAQLCGSYPLAENYTGKGTNGEWYEAEKLYLSHNKFPTNNINLRAVFFRRQRNFIIKIIYFLFGWLLPQKQKKCSDPDHSNKAKGQRCFTLEIDSKTVHYTIDKHDDIYLEADTKQPSSFFQRILLLGYRASYIQSSDMMAVCAACTITVFVSLLLPLGNFYLWFIIAFKIVDETQVYTVAIPVIYSIIELIIIGIFAMHFAGIMYRSMNKIVDILIKESKSLPEFRGHTHAG